MKKALSRAVPLALALISLLTVAPLAAQPGAPKNLTQALGLEVPCAAAAKGLPATPEHRMVWWPDRCGACSLSVECLGLLDGTACDTGEGGGRAICRSTGELCVDSNVDDAWDEVSCYCDVIS